jgi:type IV pilus assembly protein PilV
VRRPGSTIARAGFSLVEVLIALVVLSLGILAVASMASSAIKQVQVGFNITNSTLAAQQVLDAYAMQPFDSIALGNSADTVSLAGIDYTVASAVTDVSTQLSTKTSDVIYKIVVYSGGGMGQRTAQRFETFVYNPNAF